MAEVPVSGPPTDKRSERVLERFRNSKLVTTLRTNGTLTADERVLVGIPLFRVSPAIAFLYVLGVLPGAFITLLVQRMSHLIVTDRRVLVTPWSLGGKKPGGVLTLDRPVHFAPPGNPKRGSLGTKVGLPLQVTGFLGQGHVYAQLGPLAVYAFTEAATASGPQGA